MLARRKIDHVEIGTKGFILKWPGRVGVRVTRSFVMNGRLFVEVQEDRLGYKGSIHAYLPDREGKKHVFRRATFDGLWHEMFIGLGTCRKVKNGLGLRLGPRKLRKNEKELNDV